MNIENWSVVLFALLAPLKPEFHQTVDYRIEARLDEPSGVLAGRGRMRYTNRSPDALDSLYFHLHLNAFRPNSAWATRELQFGNRRFQNLDPDDHAFERLSSLRVDGKPVKPVFPFAPDSTVMAIALPAKLRPERTVTVEMDWTARAATVARRQGRAGRKFDWAHWYPRIAVYDTAGWQAQRLLPQGEFHGEFASYDVTLDVADDQVIAATGVPVSGDPGWERVNADKTNAPMLKRDAYPAKAAESLGLLTSTATQRKRVRWRADKVIHFAWAADPAFVYEGGRHGDVALHSLYLPGDSFWPGRVMNEMKASLAFFDSIMGPYVYPQLTSLRRIDTGGTEFPMVNMNGFQPPVNHEVAHEWVHAMLANNEFREGWLDEGLASYFGFMYAQSKGQRPRMNTAAIARLDSAGNSQPIGMPASNFRNFNIYQVMTYSKPSAVFHMLRYVIGETAFRSGLRLYFHNNKLTHVDENDFKTAMEQASGQDLDWFFAQWIHTTNTLDYAITNVETQAAGTAWRTRVELTRTGDIWMPVDLKVGDKITRIATRDRVYQVLVETSEKPATVVLDPDGILIDIVRGNNTRAVN